MSRSRLPETRFARLRRRLEDAHERLAHMERLAAIGQFAAGVAHELRNPLANITNVAFLLRHRTSPAMDPMILRNLDVLDREIARAMRVIEDLTAFARPQPLRLETVSLPPVIGESLKRLCRLTRVRVVMELGDGPCVRGDPDQLQQVFVHLIDNAVRAMEGKGHLTIRSGLKNGWAEVAFQDTGPGIPPDAQEKIFDPLFTTKAGGMGLGLPLCRHIVHIHGGEIDFETDPGRGTTFRVRLPPLAVAPGDREEKVRATAVL